jgi:hypothetical protein
MNPCGFVKECKGEQLQAVTRAFDDAKIWLPRVQKVMIAYTQAPADRANRGVAAALKTHFAWSEEIRKELSFPEVPGTVLDTIRKLQAKIGVPFGASCGVEQRDPDPRWKGDLAKVLAAAVLERSNCFMYTPNYFGKDAKTRAKVVIHEMCHSWLDMDDVVYEFEQSYPGGIRQAFNNADSYAGLIRDLGSK